jgi:MFS transporter, SP family, general alpha glucoside:H+ symporter
LLTICFAGIPFAIQWIWPVPLMLGCYLMPESPWYLVRQDRLEEAKHSLSRLNSNKSEEQLQGQLAQLVHTVNIEVQIEKSRAGATYFDLFRGVELRRTEIACVAFFGQILSGSTFAYVSWEEVLLEVIDMLTNRSNRRTSSRMLG